MGHGCHSDAAFDTVGDKELPSDASSYARTAKRVIVCRGAREIANVPRQISNETAGRLSRLEAPLVDLQRLELRLQRGGRHAEPSSGAEGAGHAVLWGRPESLAGPGPYSLVLDLLDVPTPEWMRGRSLLGR